jgi:diacylglycerol kinase (ATP)
LRRLFNALFYSLSGLKLAYRHESAFRQEIALALMLIPLACVLPVAAVERVLLIGSVLLVLVVELLNSSVEAAIDRIGFDTHRLSKRAKDLGSAAVPIALLGLTTTWGVLAVPEMIAQVQTLWDEMCGIHGKLQNTQQKHRRETRRHDVLLRAQFANDELKVVDAARCRNIERVGRSTNHRRVKFVSIQRVLASEGGP